MTTIKDTGSHQAPERAPEGHASRSAAHTAMGVLRLILGWTFLWAFFDKLLALGYSTGKDPVTGNVDRFGDAAWIHGGSPTEGFLGFAADGPFQSFYNSIAGDAWADWAFMFGLPAIGVSLTFGIFSRLGTFAGVAMYLLMWTVVLPRRTTRSPTTTSSARPPCWCADSTARVATSVSAGGGTSRPSSTSSPILK